MSPLPLPPFLRRSLTSNPCSLQSIRIAPCQDRQPGRRDQAGAPCLPRRARTVAAGQPQAVGESAAGHGGPLEDRVSVTENEVLRWRLKEVKGVGCGMQIVVLEVLGREEL